MPKHPVALIHEIPEGTARLVEIRGKRLAVVHHRGEFFALDDTCPHRGGPLHEGTLDGGVLTCPWHHWQFELRTGVSPVNPLSRVGTYSISLVGATLFVEIDGEGEG